MNYEIIRASYQDVLKLKEYKLKKFFDYAKDLPTEEVNRINNYVESHIPEQLKDYKIIVVNGKKIGSLLVVEKDNGVLLDEIYLEDNYRNQGIGSDIIKKVIDENKIVYLWIYKLNMDAIKLYKRLGFKGVEETETRYYMKCVNCLGW